MKKIVGIPYSHEEENEEEEDNENEVKVDEMGGLYLIGGTSFMRK